MHHDGNSIAFRASLQNNEKQQQTDDSVLTARFLLQCLAVDKGDELLAISLYRVRG